MRFQVPQFIEVEDKIVGSLTFKQALYLIGSVGIGIILYRFVGGLGILIAIPLVGFGIALAFYKMNGKPLIFTVEAAFNYIIRGRLYLWRKETGPLTSAASEHAAAESLLYVPKLSKDKLKDMTWNLDIKEGAAPGAAEAMRNMFAEKAAQGGQGNK